MRELAEEELRGYQEAARPVREERVAEAREALAISPDELAELAKTDPLLAASVEDPDSRAQMQLFFSLPSDAMQEYLEAGFVTLSYATAPAALQQGCRDVLNQHLAFEQARKEGRDEWMIETLTYGMNHPDNVTFSYRASDTPWGGGMGTWLGPNVYRSDGGYIGFASARAAALPPRLPLNHEWELKRWREMLVRTGVADEKTAQTLLAELAKKSDQLARGYEEHKKAVARREPQSPELHKVLTLPFTGDVERIEVQRYIAEETGISLVSDYFTSWGPTEIPKEARAAMPAWRLLYLLGEKWFWTYDWTEAGNCLVFHDRHWYTAAPQEFPESMTLAYREKLKQHGRFTLEDIAAAAVEWERRRPGRPVLPEGFGGLLVVPDDLRKAGLSDLPITSVVTLIYAALTPEQQEKARGAEGLPYQEMTAKQQELVLRSSTAGDPGGDNRPLPDDQIPKAVYYIRERTETVQSEPGLVYQLYVQFPSRRIRASVWLHPPEAAPAS